MEISTIRITKELLTRLQRSRKQLNYSTMQELIASYHNFFVENGLRPDEKVNYHLTNAIQEINHNFKTRDDSLRKWIGKISHIDLTSIHKDLEIIKALIAENYNDKVKENIQDLLIVNEVKVREEKDNITENKIQFDNDFEIRHKKIIAEKNEVILKYQSILQQVLQQAPIQSTKNANLFFLSISKDLLEDIKTNYL